jgi:intracellular multiplication protein IcmE
MTETDPLRPEDFEPHRSPAGNGGMRQGFSDMWREQPLVRLIIILVPVIAVVALVIGTMGSSKNDANPSVVSRGSSVKAIPGGDGAPPAYNQAVIDTNQQRVQQAAQTGGSSIPTPVSNQSANQPEAPADPLARFETAPPVVTSAGQVSNTSPQQQPLTQAPPPVQPQQMAMAAQPAMIDQALAQAMHQEMQSLMSSVVPKAAVITRVTKEESSNSTQNQQAQAASPTEKEGPVIIPAGTVIYGQTLTEANSDLKSPILVSILSGPFAGGRGIGTFEKPQNCDCLVIAFGTIIKDAREYKISGIAVDPETTSTALETDIDHHYFDRFVLPAAAGFVQGVGQVAQQSGTTTTTSAFGTSESFPPATINRELISGLGTGAQAIGNALNQNANRPITIHVAGGTPIGILFTASVHETSDQ